MNTFSFSSIPELSDNDLIVINGGATGDAAYWIGRTYVYYTAHFLTGGLSTLYLILK